MRDNTPLYTPRELMVGAGINTGVYNQWLYRGIFTATIKANGPGTISTYTMNDILTVALVVKIRELGVSLKSAKAIAMAVMLDKENAIKNGAVDPYRKICVTLHMNGVICIDELLRGTHGLVLDVGKIRDGVLLQLKSV